MTPTHSEQLPGSPRVALITGGSRGLGHALAAALVQRDWQVVIDGRDARRLSAAVDALPMPHRVTALAGDVADPAHRRRLARAAAEVGGADLLVHNASALSPGRIETQRLARLAELSPDALTEVYAVNAVAPLALTQLVLDQLVRTGGRIVGISSDAAVEAYPSWGGYGSSKAALDQLLAVLAVELPALRVYSFDPGDMRTELARQAFGEQENAERPDPATVVPALLRLVTEELPSGRWTVDALRTEVSA